jgi:hypothetical protein
MPATIAHKPWTGQDGYGERTFGASTDYRCRIQEGIEKVPTAGGEDQIARGRIYLAASPGVQPEDEVTLPDSSKPQILAVLKQQDQAGAHHEVIIFK